MSIIVPNANPAGVGVLTKVRKTITFTGAAGVGAVGTVLVATITGRVYVSRVTAFCTTDLTEAGATATLALGTSSDVDAFIAATNAVEIDANEWWGTTVPAQGAYQPANSLTGGFQTSQLAKWLSQNIILTVGAQAVNGGVLVIDVWYEPITDDGNLA